MGTEPVWLLTLDLKPRNKSLLNLIKEALHLRWLMCSELNESHQFNSSSSSYLHSIHSFILSFFFLTQPQIKICHLIQDLTALKGETIKLIYAAHMHLRDERHWVMMSCWWSVSQKIIFLTEERTNAFLSSASFSLFRVS